MEFSLWHVYFVGACMFCAFLIMEFGIWSVDVVGYLVLHMIGTVVLMGFGRRRRIP